jgi:predicted MPP superfamily phosphohydrolase
MARFLVVWITITSFGWLVLGAFFAPVLPGGAATVLAAALLASAPMLVLLRGFTRPAYPRRVVRLFVLRPFWYVQLLLPLTTIGAVTGGTIGAVAGAVGGGLRDVVVRGGRTGAIIMLGLAIGFFVAGYLGSRRLVVRRFVASSPRLPAAFDGFRVVQLSDLHVGPHTPRGKLSRIAAAIRDARPDLVALTGDLVDDYVRDVEAIERGLGRIEAAEGVLAIPGNHDVYAGWAGVRRGLEERGMTVLVNAAVRLERDGESIAVLGTGDPAARHWHREGSEGAAPDIPLAVARARELAGNDGYILALSHNPVLWPALARERVALTLSGHTHWGQMAIPGFRWSLASPFLLHAMGEYVSDDAVLYVHPGTNYWGLPFRLGTPPEVAVITLRRGSAAFEVERDV